MKIVHYLSLLISLTIMLFTPQSLFAPAAPAPVSKLTATKTPTQEKAIDEDEGLLLEEGEEEEDVAEEEDEEIVEEEEAAPAAVEKVSEKEEALEEEPLEEALDEEEEAEEETSTAEEVTEDEEEVAEEPAEEETVEEGAAEEEAVETEGEEAAESEEVAEEGEVSDAQLLITTKVAVLMVLSNIISEMSGNKTLQADVKRRQENLQKLIIDANPIGLLKFKKYQGAKAAATEEEETETITPRLVGTLYDTKGASIRTLTAGPFEIAQIRVNVYNPPTNPSLEMDLSFFNNKGKLVQEPSEETGTFNFNLAFEKPFQFPIGVKQRVPLKSFDLTLAPDQKVLSTEAKLFGLKDEAPASITLDFSQPPFTFNVKANNIPITVFADKVKTTPLKNMVLKTLSLDIIPLPLSIKIAGIADMSKVNMGVSSEKTTANFVASLGTDGLVFVIDMKEMKIPGNLGIIHSAKLRIAATR